MNREEIIAEAEAYQRDGMPLPLDLISALMAEGIDHTLYQDRDEADASDPHNVD
jgi:hypothetical protein